MDKVQFNIEVVNMRKVIKRVKVLITHSLTRHIAKLRKKKGTEQQILKNKRRAERFVAEIEAMKDLQPDTVSKKAATMKKTLPAVLNNPKSSAQDRVLARIVHHKLMQERLAKFRDMVTRDFLRTGTKKYKRLRRSKFESEGQARLKEEEDYQATLEKMVSADKMDDDDDDDDDDDEYSQKFARKMRTMDTIDQDDDSNNDDVTIDDSYSLEKMMIKKLMGRDSSDEDDSSGSDREEVTTKPEREQLQPRLEDEFAPRISQDAALQEKSHSAAIGKRNLDSMFLGSLSSMEDEDGTKSTTQRNKDKGPGKQPPKAGPAPGKTQDPAKTTRHKVPRVDQPNPVRHTPGEKLIPGINCHPDLPPRHARRDTHEKKSGRQPFPTRPQSKQLPIKPLASQSRYGAKQHPTLGKHPTSATTSSRKQPAPNKTLHPSWEASKKRKEESKIVPFQGQKITFDD